MNQASQANMGFREGFHFGMKLLHCGTERNDFGFETSSSAAALDDVRTIQKLIAVLIILFSQDGKLTVSEPG